MYYKQIFRQISQTPTIWFSIRSLNAY